MRAVYVLIICFVLVVLSMLPSSLSDMVNDQCPMDESDDVAILTLDDMIIPPGGQDNSWVTIENVEDLIIAKFDIVWDPLVISFDSFDNSLSPFDYIFCIDDVPGILSITAYKFGSGIDGPIIVGNLSFIPSEGTSVGDWCIVNIIPDVLYNESTQTIPAVGYDAIAKIGVISIDINQSNSERGFPIRHASDGDWAGAQSFKPNYDYLDSIDLYLRRFGMPEYDLVVELREDNPDGLLVHDYSFSPEEVNGSWDWISVDFSGVMLDLEKTYCIVIPGPTDRVDTSFGYEWGYVFKDVYPDGSFWFTRDGGGLWRNLPDSYEFTLRTYGYS